MANQELFNRVYLGLVEHGSVEAHSCRCCGKVSQDPDGHELCNLCDQHVCEWCWQAEICCTEQDR